MQCIFSRPESGEIASCFSNESFTFISAQVTQLQDKSEVAACRFSTFTPSRAQAVQPEISRLGKPAGSSVLFRFASPLPRLLLQLLQPDFSPLFLFAIFFPL
uniref:Uncharacterized protein n=1 Tax=Sphaerodactylus townsendi TaxID=933632 RepID=A0ACB8EMH0_9SAUR